MGSAFSYNLSYSMRKDGKIYDSEGKLYSTFDLRNGEVKDIHLSPSGYPVIETTDGRFFLDTKGRVEELKFFRHVKLAPESPDYRQIYLEYRYKKIVSVKTKGNRSLLTLLVEDERGSSMKYVFVQNDHGMFEIGGGVSFFC